jgi:hypothetical protein
MNGPAIYRASLHTIFRVESAGTVVDLELAEVTDEIVSGDYTQFSLYFHGSPDQLLPQGTYTLDHDALGPLTLFIVPVIGSSRERIVYEACFSQLKA